MRRLRTVLPFVVAFGLVVLLGACNIETTNQVKTPPSNPVVQMIPDPTDHTTSIFASGVSTSTEYLDDSAVEVSLGFTFPFFGNDYTTVFVNTNGGVTFGGADTSWDQVVATDIAVPGIAILWGDLDPSQGDPLNPDQINYRKYSDRFVLMYTDIRRHDKPDTNTMTLTLYSDGHITMTYDVQETTYAMVGVFDGSQAGYSQVGLLSPPTYDNFSAVPGTIVFDPYVNPALSVTVGQLDGTTITFNP